MCDSCSSLVSVIKGQNIILGFYFFLILYPDNNKFHLEVTINA